MIGKIALILTLLLISGTAKAEFEPEFRSLALGLEAQELETEGYDQFFCGSNGGPPLAVIDGWTDFAKCSADVDGLHEVVVEFGNRTERISQLFREQYNEELWIQQFGGTRIANFPVVLSLLLDDEGVVRAFRAVTDARAPLVDRGRSYLLRFRVYSHYPGADWQCIEREPSGGRTPVGETYLDEVCLADLGNKTVRVEAHVYRRRGQTGVDSTGNFAPGEYESSTRWEVWDNSLDAAIFDTGEEGDG